MHALAAGPSATDTHISSVQWMILAGYVLGVLIFDRLVLNRKPRELTLRQSGFQAAFFVCLSLLFNAVFVLPRYGAEGFKQYIGVYVGEFSLSIDNLFILMIILKTCAIPREFHQKALYWGINIAVVMRGGMIIGGTAALKRFEWAMLIVAAYMIYVGINQIRTGDDEADITQGRAYKFLTRIIPMTYRTYGDKLFIRQGGKVLATLLFLSICLIGNIDAVFALDSIPTAIALSSIMYVTVAGNINGVLGLRPMYFLMAHITKYITRLNWGLACVCCGVGFKLIVGNVWFMHDVLHITPLEISLNASLAWIACSLAFAYIAGRVWPPKDAVDVSDASNKRSTMVRIYLDCGSVMDGEWRIGLMSHYFNEVVGQARYYDSVGDVPLFGFGETVEPYPTLAPGESPSAERHGSLGVGSDLALALRHAAETARKVLGTHVVIIMTAGVFIDDESARAALLEMPSNAFVVFVRVSDESGGAAFLQELDDLSSGEDDRCNTVHATDDLGRPKDRIEYEVGAELDRWLNGRGALLTKVA